MRLFFLWMINEKKSIFIFLKPSFLRQIFKSSSITISALHLHYFNRFGAQLMIYACVCKWHFIYTIIFSHFNYYNAFTVEQNENRREKHKWCFNLRVLRERRWVNEWMNNVKHANRFIYITNYGWISVIYFRTFKRTST